MPRTVAVTARLTRVALMVSVWLLLGFVSGSAFLLGDSRSMVLAGHEAVVRPSLDNHAVIHTGPLLPDLRMPLRSPVGLDIELGASEVSSADQLVERYAVIAAEPEAQIAKVSDAVVDMVVSAALRGFAVGAMPVAVWVLIGKSRRHELYRSVRRPAGAAGAVALLVLPVLVWQPWDAERVPRVTSGEWIGVEEFLDGAVPVPEALAGLELLQGTTTVESKRLLLSAVDTYDKSKEFYDAAATAAGELDLRTPEASETVAILVSDRHDNIGMDHVARAIADQAGATAILDAGDDTSTGQEWEAFSLDSLARAFRDVDRWAVAGNHDNGTFVREHLTDAGWVMPEGDVVEGPGGGLLLGIDDPRASGLGNWRDTTGATFSEVAEALRERACESEERVATLLVHDANLGKPALEAGCVDLVVGGHTHVQAGPTEVVAESGAVGYSLTNGTTGGAAYAIALGSKPRRDAHVNLITYREGRPVGVQTVKLQTDGTFVVSEWTQILPHAEGESPTDRLPAVTARGSSVSGSPFSGT